MSFTPTEVNLLLYFKRWRTCRQKIPRTGISFSL